jgi:hypothetical protein
MIENIGQAIQQLEAGSTLIFRNTDLVFRVRNINNIYTITAFKGDRVFDATRAVEAEELEEKMNDVCCLHEWQVAKCN